MSYGYDSGRRRRKVMGEINALGRNWAGTYTSQAEKLHRPKTIEQVQQIVARATSVHVLGSRRSFNSIADFPGGMPSRLSRPCVPSRTTSDLSCR
jgi:hypothetical protein